VYSLSLQAFTKVLHNHPFYLFEVFGYHTQTNTQVIGKDCTIKVAF